jgi:predicted NUDIX family NTP pyrophosphohydrolase
MLQCVAAKLSAGILVFRRRGDGVEVLLAHPGGPFWSRKDDGAWSIPKGEHAPEEDSLAAARREFAEELGAAPPDGSYLDLGSVVQSNRKRVSAWAVAGEFDPAQAVSNTAEIEWPPRSGRRLVVPEVDRVEWFSLDTARRKLIPAQAAFLDRLVTALDSP